MRLHRFFVGQKIEIGENITISSSELTNQIKNVFRMKAGDRVVLFNGGEYDFECSIVNIDNTMIELMPEESTPCRNIIEKNIILCASVIKKDNFEFIVEKATELGVSSIVPVISERSEKKLLNIDRLNKIAIEASEQSGRNNIPAISDIKKLADVVEDTARKDMNIVVFHTDPKQEMNNKSSAPELSEDNIAIFIGPEGGWTDDEIDRFHKSGAHFLSLGKGILRAETAAIVAVSRFV